MFAIQLLCNESYSGLKKIFNIKKTWNPYLRYVQAGNKFYELRGAKLVAELENKLGVRLGSTVSVKLNNPDGTPRLCSTG